MGKILKRTMMIVAALIPVFVIGNLAIKQNQVKGSITVDSIDKIKSDLATVIYKDGIYTVKSFYQTPEGKQSISVVLTIAKDVVTNSTVTSLATGQTSDAYVRQLFLPNYQGQVVGKKLASLNLTRVSGASLTTRGFNEAVHLIQSQAKI